MMQIGLIPGNPFGQCAVQLQHACSEESARSDWEPQADFSNPVSSPFTSHIYLAVSEVPPVDVASLE